jgi:hypothetical protein
VKDQENFVFNDFITSLEEVKLASVGRVEIAVSHLVRKQEVPGLNADGGHL